ncbi:MAG: prolyl-tRNA synthetase [Candidatus Magasanikbacteria bacterium]|nr:prolyl-tRNA synthetase [Candidatus Magasanikbacteria bacterium]
MRQSQLFTKTRKEAPHDEISKNARLLIRAGFVHKELAGVYAYLPLGLMVIEKIKQIVREEMNVVGGQEIAMAAIQRKELWEMTDRWDDTNVDVWFKSTLKNGTEIGLGWSHEEPITDMMKNFVSSYRDLPIFVYQFQTKFRNELRAKSGIMRGREFLMKDMYSYTIDEAQHQKFYDSTIQAYLKIFRRVGLGDDTFVTFASGGAFTQFSHEFQTISDAGEDSIYIHKEKNIAINKEVMSDTVLADLGVTIDELVEVKTAEVGNIFNFGTIKSTQLDFKYINEAGEKIPVFLGSYGIGITRLMGVIVERFSDEKGIMWPKSIAPFHVHLVSLCSDVTDIKKADNIYQKMLDKGIEVLYDDRADRIEVLYDDRADLRPGEKFADSDLIGIPKRIIVSPKTLAQDSVEVKMRNGNNIEMVTLKNISYK